MTNRHNAHGRLQVDGDVSSFAPDAAVIGRRVQLAHNGPPGTILTQATQLISARVNAPRQWVVTLMQPVTKRSGVNPWINTFDGDNAYPPVAPHCFTAPLFPAADLALRATLRWGAGGASWETAFDWPLGGGVFGITADVVDLNAVLVASYAEEVDVPMVGAFMVPGVAADPSPLRWMEQVPEPLATGAFAFWGVKPYARALRVAAPEQTAAYVVEWFDTAGGELWRERVTLTGGDVGSSRLFDVPPRATVVKVTNSDAGNRQFYLEWQIGLV